MLSESQIKQATSYVFEYAKYNEYMRDIQKRIHNPYISNGYREIWRHELKDIKQHCQEIRDVVQEKFGVDLQRIGTVEHGITITPIQVLHEIQRQGKNPEHQLPPSHTSDSDRPQELIKEPPPPVDSYKVELERHGEPKKPEPEPEQLTEQTFTVTHPEQKKEVAFEDRYKNYVPRRQRSNRDHDFEQGKSHGREE